MVHVGILTGRTAGLRSIEDVDLIASRVVVVGSVVGMNCRGDIDDAVILTGRAARLDDRFDILVGSVLSTKRIDALVDEGGVVGHETPGAFKCLCQTLGINHTVGQICAD